MKLERSRLVWTAVAVALAALMAGCQSEQGQAVEQEQVSPLEAAQAELQQARADHETEIASLQRQYNDILQQREAELATRENENAALRQDVRKLQTENSELRRTIREVKTALRKLEAVVEPPTEPAEKRR